MKSEVFYGNWIMLYTERGTFYVPEDRFLPEGYDDLIKTKRLPNAYYGVGFVSDTFDKVIPWAIFNSALEVKDYINAVESNTRNK